MVRGNRRLLLISLVAGGTGLVGCTGSLKYVTEKTAFVGAQITELVAVHTDGAQRDRRRVDREDRSGPETALRS